MTKHQLCRNCGEIIAGNYCSACGQRANVDRLGWASLAESATSTFIGDEAYGLRGINMRKGLVMTWLTILCRPSVSISEFLRGQRRKFFNPVAILLLLSTFYAVVFTLVGKEFTPTAREGQHLFVWLICSYYDYATLHPAANILLTLPFFALGLKTVFRKKSDLRYVEYLYIGIFLAVFEMTLMILALPAELLVPWYNPVYMQTLPVFVYAAYVCWRLFGLKKKTAALRTFSAYLLEYVYMFLTALVTICLALGCYYMVAPGKFRAEFNAPSESVRSELNEDVGKGLLTEILAGIIDALGDEETPDSKPRLETPTGPADGAAQDMSPAADAEMQRETQAGQNADARQTPAGEEFPNGSVAEESPNGASEK